MVEVMEAAPEACVEQERIARSSVLQHRKVQAKALLTVAGGRSVRATAKEFRRYPNTVAAWRDRFVEVGVEGVGIVRNSQRVDR